MTERDKPQIFEDIVLKWGPKKEDGRQPEYKIPSNRVMMAIAVIEEHVTLAELGSVMRSGRVPMAKLAGAYAALLRYAGCDVTHEQVYAQLFSDTNNGVSSSAISGIVTGLLMMMMPKSVIEKAGTEEAPSDSSGAGKRKRRARAS